MADQQIRAGAHSRAGVRVARRSRSGQSGMTTLGLIILLAFLGLFAFAALRLMPVYLEYMKVASVLDGVASEFDAEGATRSVLTRSIRRRMDVESISAIKFKDVQITQIDPGFEVRAKYSHKVSYLGNVGFVVDFDKQVLVRRQR